MGPRVGGVQSAAETNSDIHCNAKALPAVLDSELSTLNTPQASASAPEPYPTVTSEECGLVPNGVPPTFMIDAR